MAETRPRIFGVVGSGVSYTLSPAIFELLFDEFGMRHGYYVFDLQERNLSDFVKFASISGIAGYNVTIPFKQRIILYLDSVDSSASACGSVNLVRSIRGKHRGTNTDWFGIERVFKDQGIQKFNGLKVLVIGAGGTARTAVRFLLSNGALDLTVVNRSKARLSRMVREMSLPGGAQRIQTLAISSVSSTAKRKSGGDAAVLDEHWDVIFNATPVLTARLFPARIFERCAVFEASYAPRRSNDRRAPAAIGGVDMLIYQALKGFEIFTGSEIDDYRSMKMKIKRKLRLRHT